jgi:VanZ family protein
VSRFLSAWLPVLGVMALIFALSAIPGLRVSNDPGTDLPLRHLAHVVVYALLTFVLLRAFGALEHGFTRGMVVLAIGLAVLYGVTDEIHQTFVPNRHGQAYDLIFDFAGALIGSAAVWLLLRLRARSAEVRAD